MKMTSKLLPLTVFFATFVLSNYWIETAETRLIYAACAMAITATITYTIQWFLTRQVDRVETLFLIMILVFAAAAVMFQNPVIYQWKPTVLFGIMALGIFINALFKKKPIMSYLMAENIKLDDNKWRTVDYMNAWFFVFMAAANAFVLYAFNIETWVNFKVIGSLVLSFVFFVFLAIYLAKHIEQNDAIQSK